MLKEKLPESLLMTSLAGSLSCKKKGFDKLHLQPFSQISSKARSQKSLECLCHNLRYVSEDTLYLQFKDTFSVFHNIFQLLTLVVLSKVISSLKTEFI
jgi:hypothetical protein